MAFTVRDWMMDLVVFVEPDSMVSETLATMRRRYIHSVIVNKTEDNQEYGIITSYDISDKIVAQDNNPAVTKAREIMNSPVIVVRQEMPLKECAQLMKENHIHHLPVVDRDENIIGMISATDFLVAAESIGHGPENPLT